MAVRRRRKHRWMGVTHTTCHPPIVDAEGHCFEGIRGLQVDFGLKTSLKCSIGSAVGGDGSQKKAKTPIDRSEWADR